MRSRVRLVPKERAFFFSSLPFLLRRRRRRRARILAAIFFSPARPSPYATIVITAVCARTWIMLHAVLCLSLAAAAVAVHPPSTAEGKCVRRYFFNILL